MLNREKANELIVNEIKDILKLFKTCPEAMTPQVTATILGQLALNSFTYGCAIGNEDGMNVARYHTAREYSKN